MTHITRAPHRYSMNLPGTFEVHDKDGRWYGTSTEFKAAEANCARLNAKNPEGEYEWTWVQ